MNSEERIKKALDIAAEYGQIDGAHHKMWTIDQMVRVLTGEEYEKFVSDYEYDKETGDEYEWDTGISP